MQKHQQWMQNRSYQQHLECIQRIKTKKNTLCYPTIKSKKYNQLTQKIREYKDTQYSYQDIKTIAKQTQNTQHAKNTTYFRSTQHQINKQNLIYQNQLFSDNDQHEKTINQYPQQNKLHLSNNNTTRNFYNSRTNHKNLSVALIKKSNISYNKQNKQSINQPQISHVQNDQRNSTNYLTLKQKELLLNNFLLGKRIIQTSPVICKKKQDLDYKKHRQMLKSRTCRRLNNQTSNYRLRKLQQHNSKIFKISDEHRIQYNVHKKYVMNLKIQSIQIFKYKFSSFENILISMKVGTKEDTHPKEQETKNKNNLKNQLKQFITKKKTIRQLSQCIPSGQLTSYNFFFSLKKNTITLNLPIIIEIKNVKSLNVISAGTFSFKFNNKITIISQNAHLYNFGKLIGTITFTTSCGTKEDLMAQC